MAATVLAEYYGASGTEPGGDDATTGIMFNREDTQTGTLTIPIPQTSPNTFYSWYKQIALAVTVADASSTIANRSVKFGTNVTLPRGVQIYFLSATSYRQASNASRPPDQHSNAAVPSDPNGDGTYVVLTTAAQVYDGASVTATSTGRNGNFCRLVFALDGTYTGGAGSLTLPNIIMGYDEV